MNKSYSSSSFSAWRVLLAVILAFVAVPAVQASSITSQTVSGAFFQSGGTSSLNGSTFDVFSFGQNDQGRGYIIGSNGLNFTLTCPPGMIECGMAGFHAPSGLFVSNMVSEGLDDIGFLGSIDGTVAMQLPGFLFGAVDTQGNFVGSNFNNGRATYGTLTDLILGNFSEYSLPLGDTSTTGRVVSGNFRCTFNTGASGAGVRCYNGTSEVALADRIGFSPRGYDAASGYLYGGRGGCAGWLDVANGGNFVAVPGQGGCQTGVITSLTQGKATIQSGSEERVYFVASGTMMNMAAFFAALGLPAARNTIGLGQGAYYGTVGNNSVELSRGLNRDYNIVLGQDEPPNSAIPEPTTFALIGTGLVGGALWRRRRGALLQRRRA